MSETQKKFYLTTPIYYVNARPHIGHAYSTIVADVIARRHRLLGDDTFFLTGTDEHGQKIERSALAAGVPPQQFADQVSATFRDLWKRMGITNDDFIRTTEPRHQQGVQKLFTTLQQNGAIYLDTYTGQYCISDEAYVDGPPGVVCPDCGNVTETVSESNFYFRLSAYQQKLLDLIEPGPNGEPATLSIQPETLRNEVLSFLRSGLKDLSISRTSFKWGIPVPTPSPDEAMSEAVILNGVKDPRISPEAPHNPDEHHVIYVWLDALANYMTALGYGSDAPEDIARFEQYWPADLHLIGKEIARFHCIYWPAFLLAANLPLPKAVVANGWLLFHDSKMSKSRGNVVRTETVLDAFGEHYRSELVKQNQPEPTKTQQDLFGTDVLRYFLLREIPFGQDGSFSFDALVQRYNSDLANGYGNLVSRTLSMIQKYFDGQIPFGKMDEKVGFQMQLNLAAVTNNYVEFDFSALLHNIMNIVRIADSHISSTAPWKLAADESRTEDLKDVLYTAAESIRIVNSLIAPILPHTAAQVFTQLGIPTIREPGSEPKWTADKLGPLSPIFPRAPKELIQLMTDMESSNAPKPAEPEPASSSPDAGPRTSAFTEPNPGATVAGSNAITTERPGTPPHHEALASGVFATEAAHAPAPSTTPATPQISIDDFVKVDLRVAQIIVAERIPKADKLLRLEVDLGYEKRQILAGIAEYYAPETLIGRKVVIVANLAPRKMRGLESNGMIVAASLGEAGQPVLASFLEHVEIGSRLK